MKARFPALKALEAFDFSFQPGLNEKEVLRLTSLEFIDNQANLLFLGPPGVGKTHLAIASRGWASINSGNTAPSRMLPGGGLDPDNELRVGVLDKVRLITVEAFFLAFPTKTSLPVLQFGIEPFWLHILPKAEFWSCWTSFAIS